MDDTIRGLYEVILQRKNDGGEGSYTAYLFEQGLDKILKKVGEESSEVIIASKNLRLTQATRSSSRKEDNEEYRSEERDEFKNEVCDLLYHILVLMAELNVPVEEVEEILEERRQKTGNLKKQKIVDKNT